MQPLLFPLAALLILPHSSAAQPADQPTSLIAVSLSGEDAVAMVDPDTGKVIRRVPVGRGPHELVASSDGTRVYVANAGRQGETTTPETISVLDTRANDALAHHALGMHRSPHDVRVSRDGSLVWVAVAPSRAVLELSAQSGVLLQTWHTDAEGGWFVEVTPDAGKIYVPHLEGKRVTSIDRRTGRRTTVLSGGAQSGIDISPDGAHAWVIDHERRRINVIAVASDEAIAQINLSSDAFGRLHFSPEGRRVVVVQDRRLTLFDAVSRKEIGTLDMPLDAKVVTVAPDGSAAAVSNPDDGRITIVDLAAMRVRGSYPVGRTPDGLVWFDVPRGTAANSVELSPASSRSAPASDMSKSSEHERPARRRCTP